jgi:hypothetical protein
MKIFNSILLILIISNFSSAQSTELNNVSISILDAGVKIYEGQKFIYFDYIFKNKSNSDKNIEVQNFCPGPLKIVHENTGKPLFQWAPPEIPNPKYATAFHPLPAKAEIVSSWDMNVGRLPNTVSLKKYLAISDSIYNQYSRLPHYLAPGFYNLDMMVSYTPTPDTAYLSWRLEVLPAEGKNRVDMIEAMKAYFYTLHKNELHYIASETEPTLWNFLKNNPQSEYAQECVSYLVVEPEGNSCQTLFRENLSCMFNMMKLIPDIKIRSNNIKYYALSSCVHLLDDFRNAGYFSDIKSYCNEYLKRLENYAPHVSEKFIRTLKIFTKFLA